MAATDRVVVRVVGKGGHGASPHQAASSFRGRGSGAVSQVRAASQVAPAASDNATGLPPRPGRPSARVSRTAIVASSHPCW